MWSASTQCYGEVNNKTQKRIKLEANKGRRKKGKDKIKQGDDKKGKHKGEMWKEKGK
jgi:hypothetical protein